MNKIINKYFEIAGVIGKMVASLLFLPAIYFTMHFAIWLNDYMVNLIVY